ncbi:MAG: hypothetical protein KKB70_01590 [Proteobacteria bacterium]|nr:hypothetical protein [Pseudomonadota bacterium]MBU1612283.1 hypothetical protein [Pseudomonadota bacterium]
MRQLLLHRFLRIGRDERGVASLLLGLVLSVLVGFAALAVDTAYIYMKRASLQTAADAGALAGANTLLAYGGNLDDIRDVALEYARRNLVDSDVPVNAVLDSDVIFLRDGTPSEDDPNQVEITISLTEERGNALDLYFGHVIGVDWANLTATARAGIVSVTTSKCIKPFMVPTKFNWDDRAEPVGSKFRDNDQLDVESDLEMATIEVYGYADEDMGATILLKPGDPSLAMVPSHYNLMDLPPVNKGTPIAGAAMLAENIRGCTGSNSETVVEAGDLMQLEPGNKVGPARSAINEVITSDPGAYWDSGTQSIEGSSFEDPMASPRVALIAFYDPRVPPVSGRTTLEVYQLGAVFIESISGKSDIQARFINAVARSPRPGSEGDGLLYMTRLLQDSSR